MTQTYKESSLDADQPCCQSLGRCLDCSLFKALADPGRLDILVRLSGCRRPCTVSEIADCLPIDLSVVSRHLAALRDAGVLKAEKRGRKVFYQVDYPGLSQRLRSISDAIDECCPADSTDVEATHHRAATDAVNTPGCCP